MDIRTNKLYFKTPTFLMTLDEVLKDFASGCVSGWTQVFVMQPFDLIKVRLVNQSLINPEYKGTFDCFRKIKK